MNRTRLALTIKSRIPREIAADRAVGGGAGAGAGARDRDGAEDKDRQQQRRQREREKGGGTAAVYRLAGKLQGAGLSAGRARLMTRSAGIQDRTGSRSAAMERTIVDSTVPAATLRRPHDSGQACFAWLAEEETAWAL